MAFVGSGSDEIVIVAAIVLGIVPMIILVALSRNVCLSISCDLCRVGDICACD